jgi:hypothetical protein
MKKYVAGIQPITIVPQAHVADPAHIVWWYTRPKPGERHVESTGTRWQRFLIRLLAKSIGRSLKKGYYAPTWAS